MSFYAQYRRALIGEFPRRLSATTSSWKKKFDKSAWDEKLRDVIYRHIGVRVRQRNVRRANASEPDLDTYLKDHICLKPFTTVETTNRGLAHFCCPDWLPTPFGTLDGNLATQWSGETAQKIRASILDGSYSYCSRQHCGWISNRTLPHRDSEEVRSVLADFANSEKTPAPQEIVLSHDRSCNLSCPSCRTDLILANKAKQAKLNKLFETAIAPLMRTAKTVYITSSGDPFGSNHFRHVIRRISNGEFPGLVIDLHTNGQLFDARAWDELKLAGRTGYVHISIDAVNPETYAVLRRGGTIERLRKNLAFIKTLRESGKIRLLEFSMVVQARNFREMPAFVRMGLEFGADVVSFQMIRNLGTYGDEEFKREFIGDKDHPDHDEFVNILNLPELSLPIAKTGNVRGYI